MAEKHHQSFTDTVIEKRGRRKGLKLPEEAVTRGEEAVPMM